MQLKIWVHLLFLLVLLRKKKKAPVQEVSLEVWLDQAE